MNSTRIMMMSLTLYSVPQRTCRATCEDDAPTHERRTTTRTILLITCAARDTWGTGP